MRKKRGAECNLHSTDLWDRPGGVTGDECFAIVQAKTLAKRSKEASAKQVKEARAEARKSAHASANALGAQLAANLKSEADIAKLKVGELKAVLTFKGVELEKTAKKADLCWLLSMEMRSTDDSVPAVGGSSGGAGASGGDAGDNDGMSGDEGSGEESDWPHSEADDN